MSKIDPKTIGDVLHRAALPADGKVLQADDYDAVMALAERLRIEGPPRSGDLVMVHRDGTDYFRAVVIHRYNSNGYYYVANTSIINPEVIESVHASDMTVLARSAWSLDDVAAPEPEEKA